MSSDAFKVSLRLVLIDNALARRILDRAHPLGAGGPFSFAHGVFWRDNLEGLLTWGQPTTNNAAYGMGLRTAEVLELRKFWMSDVPPPNAESRVLGVAVRLVRKAYPNLRALITYCEGDEKASAYKGSGWIPLAAQRYVREVTIGGKILSIREVNRRGGLKALAPGTYATTEAHRRKWAYPLDDTIRARLAQVAERLPAREEGGDSKSTAGLHEGGDIPPHPISS